MSQNQQTRCYYTNPKVFEVHTSSHAVALFKEEYFRKAVVTIVRSLGYNKIKKLNKNISKKFKNPKKFSEVDLSLDLVCYSQVLAAAKYDPSKVPGSKGLERAYISLVIYLYLSIFKWKVDDELSDILFRSLPTPHDISRTTASKIMDGSLPNTTFEVCRQALVTMGFFGIANSDPIAFVELIGRLNDIPGNAYYDYNVIPSEWYDNYKSNTVSIFQAHLSMIMAVLECLRLQNVGPAVYQDLIGFAPWPTRSTQDNEHQMGLFNDLSKAGSLLETLGEIQPVTQKIADLAPSLVTLLQGVIDALEPLSSKENVDSPIDKKGKKKAHLSESDNEPGLDDDAISMNGVEDLEQGETSSPIDPSLLVPPHEQPPQKVSSSSSGFENMPTAIIAVVCSSLIYYVAYSSNSTVKTVVFSIMATLGMTYGLSMIPYLKILVQTIGVKHQAGVDDYCKLIVTGLYMYLGLKAPAKIIETATRFLSTLQTSAVNLEGIFNAFIEVLRIPLDWANLGEWLPNLSPSFFDGKAEAFVKKLQNECPYLAIQPDMECTQDTIEEINSYLREMEDIIKNTRGPTYEKVRAFFSPYQAKLWQSLMHHHKHSRSDAGSRVETTMLLLAGGPGGGKSILASDIATALLADHVKNRSISDKEHVIAHMGQYIYRKNAIENFWSGYKKQPITIMDDIGQAKVAQPENDMVAQLINLVNTMPHALEMPDVESKGAIEFKSKYIIGTTNCQQLKTDNIHSNDAVSRRFYMFVVSPKVPANPGADLFSQKAMHGIQVGSSIDHDDLWVFTRWDNYTGRPYVGPDGRGVVLKFRQVLELVLQHNRIMEDYHVANSSRRVDLFKRWCNLEPEVIPQSGTDGIMHMVDEPDILLSENSEPQFSFDPSPDTHSSSSSSEASFRTAAPCNTLVCTGPCPCSTYDADPVEMALVQKIMTYAPSWYTGGSTVRGARRFLYHYNPQKDTQPLLHYETILSTFHIVPLMQRISYVVNVMMPRAECPEVRKGGPFVSPTDTWAEFRALIYQALKDEVGMWWQYSQMFRFTVYAASITAAIKVLRTVISLVSKIWGKEDALPDLVAEQSTALKSRRANRNEAARRGKVDLSSSHNWFLQGRPDDYGCNQMKDLPPIVTDKSIVEKNTNLRRFIEVSMVLLLVCPINVDPAVTMENCIPLGNGIDIATDIMIIPMHFLSTITKLVKKGTLDLDQHVIRCFRVNRITNTINFQGATISLREFFDPRNFFSNVYMEQNDLLSFRRKPSPISCTREVLPLFATRDEHLKLRGSRGQFLGFNVDADLDATIIVNPVTDVEIKDSPGLREALKYNIKTKAGDCGGLILISGNAPIYGMHCAGETTHEVGYASRITREDLEEAISHFSSEGPMVVADVATFQMKTLPSPGLDRFYPQFEAEYTTHQPPARSLIPSPLRDVIFPSTKDVPRLTAFTDDNGDWVFPYDIATAKVCIGTMMATNEVLYDISQSVKNFLFKDEPKWCKRLSYFAGVNGYDDLERINLTTSPGYPLRFDVRVRGIPGKRAIFGKEGVDLELPIAKELEKLVETNVAQMASGRRPLFVFTDHLKEETLPKEKIAKHKCRLFNVVPVQLLIIERMYHGAFMAWYTRNKIWNGSALGVNPFSEEWDDIAKYLYSINSDLSIPVHVSAGDYSAYDGSEKPEIHNLIMEIIDDWYSTFDPDCTVEDARVRNSLKYELFNSRHLRMKVLYTWFGSLPSGHPLTSIVNTIYNQFAFRYAWWVHKGRDVSAHASFDTNVRIIALGDDNVYSTIDPTFNDVVVSEAVAELGLVFTSENKESILTSEMRTIEQISFLKRRFVPEYVTMGRYIAPIDKTTIEELPQWMRSGKMDYEDLRSRCSDMLREASLHGREYYEYVVSRYQETLSSSQLDVPEILVDYLPKPGDWYDTYINTLGTIDYYCGDIRDYNLPIVAGQEEILSNEMLENKITDTRNNMNSTRNTFYSTYSSTSAMVDESDISLQITRESDEIEHQAGEIESGNLISEPGQATGSTCEAVTLVDALDPALLSSPDDGTLASIISFLKKPVIYHSGVLRTTDTSSTFSEYPLFGPLITESIYNIKLQGTFAIRATAVFTLQINATRFQQGRYILAYLPLGGANHLTAQAQDRINAHQFSARQVTQLPHVEIDIASEVEVTLRIPFTHYLDAVAVNSLAAGTSPGVVFMYPYSKLETGAGDSECGYTLWVHYDDVNVMGNVSYQSNVRARSGKAGPRKRIDITATEQDRAGPLTTGFSLLSKGVSSFAQIPMLTAFATPTSWALQAASGVCAAFGWSKPLDVMNANKTKLAVFPDYCNTDTTDQVTNLAMRIGNHVEILPGVGGTMEDELSLDFIKKRFAYYTNIRWDQTQGTSTALIQKALSPLEFASKDAIGTQTIISHTPISYIASFFDMYRGGIVLRIKIVKTEFHTGRLVLAFWPREVGQTLLSSFTNLQYVHKTILDLREASEWEIEIPYMATRPWLRTGHISHMSDPTLFTGAMSFGSFSLHVLNELVSPDTVPATVNILIEVAGADDFHVAMPAQNETIPAVPSTILPAPQMGEMIGTATKTTNPADPSFVSATIGEEITSFRQFLRRPMPMVVSGAWTTYVFPEVANYAFVSSTATDLGIICRDIIPHLSAMYALTRGGYRIKVLPTSIAQSDGLFASLSKLAYGSTPPAAGPVPFATGGIQTPQSLSDLLSNTLHSFGREDWGVGWNLPFYCSTHAKATVSLSCANHSYVWSPGSNSAPDQCLTLCSLRDDSPPTTILARYGADDLNFSQFIGVPLVVDIN